MPTCPPGHPTDIMKNRIKQNVKLHNEWNMIYYLWWSCVCRTVYKMCTCEDGEKWNIKQYIERDVIFDLLCFFWMYVFFWMWCQILNVRTNYIVNIWKNALFYLVFVVHFGIEKNRSFRFFRSLHGFTQICTKENTTECKCTKT